MAINDIYQVAFVQQYEEYKPVSIVHYLETADAGTGDDAAQLAGIFDTNVVLKWAGAQSASMALLCLIVTRIHPGPGHPVILSPLASSNGLLAGPGVGPQTQAVCRKYPGNDVAPFLVGRVNIAGTREEDWTEGQMVTGLKDKLVILTDELEKPQSISGYTFDPVIWSPTRKKALTPPFHVLWDETHINFGQKVLTRRRALYHDYA